MPVERPSSRSRVLVTTLVFSHVDYCYFSFGQTVSKLTVTTHLYRGRTRSRAYSFNVHAGYRLQIKLSRKFYYCYVVTLVESIEVVFP